MDFKQSKFIHFIGIGGIGVSALARICLLMGKKVTGSDMRESVVTTSLQSLGAQVFLNHSAKNIISGVDLIVYTEDVNPTSSGYVELSEAKERGIDTLKYSEALGSLVNEYYGIGVTGTNGKSTTTAILGLILEEADFDPMVVLGSRLATINESKEFIGNVRFGHGKHFVFEADEYHRHMLDSRPKAVVLTNIEADHLDYYKDLDDIKSAFKQFIEHIPTEGFVIYNADDHNAAEVCLSSSSCNKVSYGMKNLKANYIATDVLVENQQQIFNVTGNGKNLGQFRLSIPGEYNLMNALGAIAAAAEMGVETDAIKRALDKFAGIWRRFEIVGKLEGKLIISDYAHHPTGISVILAAAKQFYPGKKVLLVFQPHQKHRTKALFNEFTRALSGADQLIITEIFSVAGREKDPDLKISSLDIVQKLVEQAPSDTNKSYAYAEDLTKAEELIIHALPKVDVVILAGAGTIDQLARKLVSA